MKMQEAMLMVIQNPQNIIMWRDIEKEKHWRKTVKLFEDLCLSKIK